MSIKTRNELAFAVVEAARRLSDKRTLDSDGFWVSKREMRYLDNALADFDESLPSADDVRGILAPACVHCHVAATECDRTLAGCCSTCWHVAVDGPPGSEVPTITYADGGRISIA